MQALLARLRLEVLHELVEHAPEARRIGQRIRVSAAPDAVPARDEDGVDAALLHLALGHLPRVEMEDDVDAAVVRHEARLGREVRPEAQAAPPLPLLAGAHPRTGGEVARRAQARVLGAVLARMGAASATEGVVRSALAAGSAFATGACAMNALARAAQTMRSAPGSFARLPITAGEPMRRGDSLSSKSDRGGAFRWHMDLPECRIRRKMRLEVRHSVATP